MLKSKKRPIQNVVIALMLIVAFSKEEMINGTRPSNLGYKARKDATST
jgi:hypothetical protein